MVNGMIRLHDGEIVREQAIEDCDMILGIGITKVLEKDGRLVVALQSTCAGGEELNSAVVCESMAKFVVTILTKQIGLTEKGQKGALRWFHETFCEEAAKAMGEDVIGRKENVTIISEETDKETMMQLLMQGIADAKERKQ